MEKTDWKRIGWLTAATLVLGAIIGAQAQLALAGLDFVLAALFAVLAVEQAGKAETIKVTGVDGSPEAVEELKREGSPFIGTATQNPGAMVEKAVAIASDMLNGKQPAEKTILIPSVLVTRDSVGQYPGW